MRGLDESHGPQQRRRIGSRALLAAALITFLILTVVLPRREHLSAWTNNVSSTVSSSINSLYGYMGYGPSSVLTSESAQTTDENVDQQVLIYSLHWLIDTQRVVQADSLPAMLFNSSLPACARTLLCTLDGVIGFTGHIGLMIRSAVLADALGYSLLIDDDNWICLFSH